LVSKRVAGFGERVTPDDKPHAARRSVVARIAQS